MNQKLEVGNLPGRIGCLLLPLQGRQLLVPVTCVAEVVNPLFRPEMEADESCLHGWISWREQKIPVISFEAISGGPRPQWQDISRIAVFNAVGAAARLGFYALGLAGIPRPVHASPQTVFFEPSAESGDSLITLISQWGEDRAGVPDLDKLESIVADLERL